MFVVVCLSRLWYLEQLAAAATELRSSGSSAIGMPQDNETMTVVVSGTQGGSLEKPNDYVNNMIRLATASLPFKVTQHLFLRAFRRALILF